MPKRIEQWGEIWQIQDRPVLIANLEALINKGQQAASQLPFLSEGHIWKTIKSLSVKAAGLDGIGFDMLKALPFAAMKDLRELFHSIETQAMIPSQWGTALIALIPKSSVIERRIALVATLYRLWCRVRSEQTKSWSRNIQDEYPWERAVPGTECLQVALKRAFMTEHHAAHNRTVISVLLDMSNFYDRIDLVKLTERWLDSSYPATHAALAIQVYSGQRILEAEGEASQPLWATHDILAGDPQAPLAAKVYLQRALREFHKKYPQLHSDLWIDDFSFDVVDRNPQNAARIAISAYEFVKAELEKDNLKVSPQKTGFIVSNATAKRILQQQLTEGGPKVHDVMRDLGIDCTAGRLRRIQTMRARRKKAGRKTVKMTSLKIPNRAIRLKLYKSSILAGINWGHEAMGLAPQVRRRIRATMARQMGCHRTGSIDIVFSMHPRHRDPDFGAFADQVRLYRRFYGNWPEALAKDLAKAWHVQKAKLTEDKHPHFEHTCRGQPFKMGSSAQVEFQVMEGNVLARPTFCGKATTSLQRLAQPFVPLLEGQTPAPIVGTSTGPVIDLELLLEQEVTGHIFVQALLVQLPPAVRPVAGGESLSRVDEELFEDSVERLGDLSHAEDEVNFYEEALQLQRQRGAAGLGPLLGYTLEYAGVLTHTEATNAGKKRTALLVMRNLRCGAVKFRFLDIKIGQKTAQVGWQGKSRAAALRQSLVDGITNSSCEGFRLEEGWRRSTE
eukprot:g13886.t1